MSSLIFASIIISDKFSVLNTNSEGIVIKSTGSWYLVRDKDTGEHINCKIKGKFRIEGIKTTNPVCVGDHVVYKKFNIDNTGLITEIRPRENYIIRRATKLSKQSHIIAANIDQAILIATLAKPRTSTGFIDRFLVTAEAYHIPVVIVLNKTDIYDEEMKKQHDEIMQIYSKIGYKTLGVSALKKKNIEAVKEIMKNKISLIAGHSGVGKSELINVVQPGLDLKTADISNYHQKGKHTTTFAEMFELSFGGYIIDTPGIKEFGLVDFEKDEVWEFFPEMRKYSSGCQYYNCTHVHEPGCAVIEALKKGEISTVRYNNYLSIIEEDGTRRR